MTSESNDFDNSFPWTPEKTNAYLRERTEVPEVKGHPFSKLLVGLFVFLVEKLSWESADGLGTFIGKLMAILRIRRRVAMINLDIAFGDRKTKEEKQAIYKESLIRLGRHMLDYLRVSRMDEDFWRRYEFEGRELLEEACKRGKGVIFIGGHIGVWEIAAGKAGMEGYAISIVAKRVANPVIDRLILQARLGMNLGTIPHKDSMTRVREGIMRGESVIMAVDQNMKRSQGVFVEWMGRTASTVRSNAWVARETGATVLVGYARRIAPGRFKLVVGPEIPWQPHPEDPEQELLINTSNQARAVEQVIYEHPEEWLWIHRRWKVQPEGTPNPYDR